MIPDCPTAGPLLMVDIPGTELDRDTREHLRRHRIRAVCLFRKNINSEAQLAQLCADLRATLGDHALIAIDQEGGGVVRTTFAPFPPSAMSLGASGDLKMCRQVGAATARTLAAFGINWNFAPVLDVNVNPHNPVIGDRAFGADTRQVTPLALAWLQGSLSSGVAGCVKHFPGHGDTQFDSHLSLPRVDKTREQLERQEFAPFREAVQNAEVPAVMTAHIVYPALDAAFPATLSRRVLTTLLREEWGYGGVIITDSMGMKAIDDHHGRGEAAVLALGAGADMVMALGRRSAQEETLQAVESALQERRVRDSTARFARLDALARRYPSLPQVYPPDQRTSDAALMQTAWERGLSTFGEPRFPPPGAPVTLVALNEVPGQLVSEAGLSGAQLLAELRTVYDVQACLVSEESLPDWGALRARGRTVILASTTRQRFAGWRGASVDLHLALWNPYAVLDIDAPALLSYGARPEALQAVLRVLRGELVPTGQVPFTFASPASGLEHE